MNNNETEIRQLINNWAKAVRENNMEGIMAFHASDMVMYDVPPPFESIGLDAYRETWDTFFKYTRAGVFDIDELHVVAGDDVAFCYAKMHCEDKANKEDYERLDFRLTIGLKKVNGQWVILHEHHSIPAE